MPLFPEVPKMRRFPVPLIGSLNLLGKPVDFLFRVGFLSFFIWLLVLFQSAPLHVPLTETGKATYTGVTCLYRACHPRDVRRCVSDVPSRISKTFCHRPLAPGTPLLFSVRLPVLFLSAHALSLSRASRPGRRTRTKQHGVQFLTEAPTSEWNVAFELIPHWDPPPFIFSLVFDSSNRQPGYPARVGALPPGSEDRFSFRDEVTGHGLLVFHRKGTERSTAYTNLSSTSSVRENRPIRLAVTKHSGSQDARRAFLSETSSWSPEGLSPTGPVLHWKSRRYHDDEAFYREPVCGKTAEWSRSQLRVKGGRHPSAFPLEATRLCVNPSFGPRGSSEYNSMTVETAVVPFAPQIVTRGRYLRRVSPAATALTDTNEPESRGHGEPTAIDTAYAKRIPQITHQTMPVDQFGAVNRQHERSSVPGVHPDVAQEKLGYASAGGETHGKVSSQPEGSGFAVLLEKGGKGPEREQKTVGCEGMEKPAKTRFEFPALFISGVFRSISNILRATAHVSGDLLAGIVRNLARVATDNRVLLIEEDLAGWPRPQCGLAYMQASGAGSVLGQAPVQEMLFWGGLG